MSFIGEVSAIVMRPSSSAWAGRDRRMPRRGSLSEVGSSPGAWIKDGHRKPVWSRGASIRGECSPTGPNHGALSPDERSRGGLIKPDEHNRAGLIKSEGSRIGPVVCRRDECSRRPSSLAQAFKRRLVLSQGGLSPGACHGWRVLPRHLDSGPDSDGSPECFRGSATAVMLVPTVNAVVRADRSSPSPLPPFVPRPHP